MAEQVEVILRVSQVSDMVSTAVPDFHARPARGEGPPCRKKDSTANQFTSLHRIKTPAWPRS